MDPESKWRANMSVWASALVYPGAGQVIQRRWLSAFLIMTGFTISLVAFAISLLFPLVIYYLNALQAQMLNAVPPPIPHYSLWTVVGSFIVTVLFYVIGIVDAGYHSRKMKRLSDSQQ